MSPVNASMVQIIEKVKWANGVLVSYFVSTFALFLSYLLLLNNKSSKCFIACKIFFANQIPGLRKQCIVATTPEALDPQFYCNRNLALNNRKLNTLNRGKHL